MTSAGTTEATGIDARSLVEHVSEIVSLVGADGILRYISPSVTRLLGWRPEELVGRPVTDFMAIERHTDFAEAFARVVEEPGPHGPFGLNFVTVNGSVRLLQSLVTNRLDDPDVNGLVTVARDETDRIAAEDARRRAEARFRALVQFSSDIVLLLDPEGVVRYASPSVHQMIGLDADADIHSVFDIVHPDDRAWARRLLRVALTRPALLTATPADLRVQALDGSWRHLEVVGTNLVHDPDVAGIVVNGRDVTERRRAEDLVLEQSQVLEGIALGVDIEETLGRIIAMVDARIPGGVSSVCSLVPDGSIRHRHAPALPRALVEALDGSPTDCELGRTVRRPEPAVFVDVTVHRAWAHLREVTEASGLRACWTFPLLVPSGADQLGLITLFHQEARPPTGDEVALMDRARTLAAIALERHRFEGQLEHQAVHDVLTGLPNRLLLLDRVEQALARSRRHDGEVDVAVLFVDLDHFKVINDSLGHTAGDRLLEQVAERFLRVVRPDDTVGRFGGDEFVVVCEDVGGREGAGLLATRLGQALARPFPVGATDVHVSASIGITVATDASADPHSLIRDADAAMYEAKDRGRAGHAVFEPAFHQRLVQRLDLERALRRALDDGELDLLYQPLVALDDGRVAGVEALVRWERPGHGTVPPSGFVPVAEESGLIGAIDRWAMEQACSQLTRWRRTGLGGDLRISVNQSSDRLGDPAFADTVCEILERAGLPGEALVIELSESALAADPRSAMATLTVLADRGVHFAIDDFGTGYASLEHLRRFELAHQLKIDRSFVADLVSGSRRDRAIVSAALVLADDLGLVSVAEGVETEPQRAALQEMGCALGQGYLFCPPMTAAELVTHLERGTAP